MEKAPDLDEEVKLCNLTGNIERTYRVDGTVCPKVLLDSHRAKQHAGYILIDLDLEDAEAFLTEAYRLKGEQTAIPPPNAKLRNEYVLHEKGPLSRVVKALWFSAVVIYAKCFTEAKGRKVKLEKSIIPAHMRPCHEKIMNYRHTIIAHAGEGNLESADPELIISPENSGHPFYWLKSNVRRLEFVDDRNEQIDFQMLIKTVHNHVRKKRDQLTINLRSEVRGVPLDTWYIRAKRSSADASEVGSTQEP